MKKWILFKIPLEGEGCYKQSCLEMFSFGATCVLMTSWEFHRLEGGFNLLGFGFWIS